MKTLFLTLFLVFGFVGLVFAAPFLVCDPQVDVTEYIITGDISATTPAVDLGDGTVRMQYDLTGISEGPYNIEVKAKNIWGESIPVPFVFTKQLPDAPSNITISE